MLKKIAIALILILLGYSIYLKQTVGTFQHIFLEAQSERSIDIDWFETNKQGLLNRIENSKNQQVDSFTQNYRNYVQLTRCKSLLNTVDKNNNSIANSKQSFHDYHIIDNNYYNRLIDKQQTAFVG
ncbi:MAG: hypothetical protein L3J83_01885 [Proteobacteria bacterium]|nr:hypothetical protein [Pseudomonadota bacterium]